MPDPNVLLGTLSQSSAAIVAIIGGFLVSRLVAISSEREGLRRQLEAARHRSTQAEDNYGPVHLERLSNSQSDFFGFILDDLVKKDLDDSELDDLVEENVPRGSSFSEIQPYAAELRDRVAAARAKMAQYVHPDDNDRLNFDDLRKRELSFEERDDPIYEKLFSVLVQPLPSSSSSSYFSFPSMAAFGPMTPVWRHEIEARRLDESLREGGSTSREG